MTQIFSEMEINEDSTYIKYLVTVTPRELQLELKELYLQLGGDNIWNINKERGPREYVIISNKSKKEGPRTVGELVIKKQNGKKHFFKRTGAFNTGIISGAVRDKAGNLGIDIRCEAMSLGTNKVFNAINTDINGNYQLILLEGIYDIVIKDANVDTSYKGVNIKPDSHLKEFDFIIK